MIKAPDILLPKNKYDLTKWAVVACDQFTSQRNYWDKLDEDVGEYSTLRLIYPEVYLNDNEKERIDKINDNMQQYLDKGVFREIKESFILTERITGYGRKRLGLILAIDVEAYEYKPLSKAPIKATEMTVEERLPVRIRIRENASLELPHIMLLMDDKDKTILESLYENREELELLYDTDLNMKGGHIRGYRIKDTAPIIEKLMKLIDKDTLINKYRRCDNPFLFAVGDGNHSLATAKACWDNLKDSVTDKDNHPARYALCELVNLYEDDLCFEPIHRVVFNIDKDFIEGLSRVSNGDGHAYLYYRDRNQELNVNGFTPQAIQEIQNYIDEYLSNHKNSYVDYIHGEEHAVNVAKHNDSLAVLMPTIKKEELFRYVMDEGVLCRKAFSMGEAEEKRYYMECKKIKV